MSGVLHSNQVLVINRNWQAINITSPAQAFCQMMTESARGLHIERKEELFPLSWEEWLRLEVRDQDAWVGTTHGKIRVPTVILLSHYGGIPLRRPRLSPRALRERDGNRCQYTGRLLAPGEGNIDHVLPRSRGGETSWTNCVWSSRRVNTYKADRTPEEARLRLMKPPSAPVAIPSTFALSNPQNIEDWTLFLPQKDRK